MRWREFRLGGGEENTPEGALFVACDLQQGQGFRLDGGGGGGKVNHGGRHLFSAQRS